MAGKLIGVFVKNLLMGVGVSHVVWSAIVYRDGCSSFVRPACPWLIVLGVLVNLTCLLTQPLLLMLTPRLSTSVFVCKPALLKLACARVAGMLVVMGYIGIVF
ncbi:hypothetical protein BLA50215_07787 [Burkholderia lata]|uniref:hypothetical protein n=1 Tax=Burkholderia lata (strain ATCC 17760 / DSM 23089 / LMG 22485 / NCIMB 9086 / R18194 / 383) TaxID=482957 RepID=UPI0014539D2C|nr:hypothetical protein [Burkholderia lata]VWD64003.1 hypothetical protein BLA50215_07787 [Burkholderia lata]